MTRSRTGRKGTVSEFQKNGSRPRTRPRRRSERESTREELENPNSCLNKAADDEPIFVLRAQDLIAPGRVREWAGTAKASGVRKEKVDEALAVADAMEAWPKRRMPD